MKPLLTIKNGYITLELSPYQCASLAKACQEASEKSFEPDIDEWRTLAALFHACTVAGFTQWQLSNAELDELQAQLASLNISNHDTNEECDRRNEHNH